MEQLGFSELVSAHIKKLMEKVKNEQGEDSREYKALYYQYIKTDEEGECFKENNLKHYDASYKNNGLENIERLYKRQASIDISKSCLSHCRYCLRQNYNLKTMTSEGIINAVDYLASDEYLKEVLITGGDPFLSPKKLIELMEHIIMDAPNIKIIRIGTRVPVQGPEYMPMEVLDFFAKQNQVSFEVGLQVNHAIELQEETKECIERIKGANATIYSQNVVLRGVNDDVDSLINLYDQLRYLGIESHYLFHPVPIVRTGRFRMPVSEFLELSRLLSASGEIPGRSKPIFSLMTDVGKVVLYQGTVGEKDSDGFIDIRTGYRLQEREKWHKGYALPSSAYEDKDGFIHVKYLDGKADKLS